MRLIINRRRYCLKENIRIKLNGLVLMLLAWMCIKTGADGAAVFMGLLGVCFIIPRIKPRKRSLLYCFAKTVVDYEDERNQRKAV